MMIVVAIQAAPAQSPDRALGGLGGALAQLPPRAPAAARAGDHHRRHVVRRVHRRPRRPRSRRSTPSSSPWLVYRELDARQLFEMVRAHHARHRRRADHRRGGGALCLVPGLRPDPADARHRDQGPRSRPFTILLALNLFLLVVGLFMETNAAITVFLRRCCCRSRSRPASTRSISASS